MNNSPFDVRRYGGDKYGDAVVIKMSAFITADVQRLLGQLVVC